MNDPYENLFWEFAEYGNEFETFVVDLEWQRPGFSDFVNQSSDGSAWQLMMAVVGVALDFLERRKTVFEG